MKATIICPLYNAGLYIEELYKNINMQKKVDIIEVKFIVTASKDDTEEKLRKMNVEYEKISLKDFSHSLVREKAAYEAKGDILVFITQDIKIKDDLWLFNLVSGIENGQCEAAFSRQVGYAEHTIEKYTREINYPNKSRIVTKDEIDRLGIMTFFFSDAASAISKKVFVELRGYDNKDLPTNEDMYFAHKLIMKGYRIKYCADSEVVHSHNFKWKETYKRYKDIGKFFRQNAYFNNYKASERGLDVLFYICKRALQDKRPLVIIEAIMNFGIRFIGMKVGQYK